MERRPKAVRLKWSKRSFRAGDENNGVNAYLEQNGLSIHYWTDTKPGEGHYGRCLIPIEDLKDAIASAEKARRKKLA